MINKYTGLTTSPKKYDIIAIIVVLIMDQIIASKADCNKVSTLLDNLKI